MSTLVFLPAWNEAENLPAVLDELKLVLPEVDVLVVDDGSTDGTAEVARARGAEVVSFSDLTTLGSMAEAKAKGRVRIEGKDYVMADGDVVEFRFNV